MKKKVFLSHSHSAQRELSIGLMKAAEDLGYSVWSADLYPSARLSIATAIQTAILGSDIVVIILDRENPNTFYEIGLAIGAGKPVLILADPSVAIPSQLVSMPYLQLTGDSLRDATNFRRELAERGKELPSRSEQERPAFDELATFTTDPAYFAAITPRRFEELISTIIQEIGFAVEEPPNKAIGFDFILKSPELKGSVLVEVKKLLPQSMVSINHVQILHAAVSTTRAQAGLLIASSTFTMAARAMAAESRTRLTLLSLSDVLELKNHQDALYAFGLRPYH